MTDSLKTVADTLFYNPKLGNLYPIFLPEPLPFKPVTVGWYIVFGVISVTLLFTAYRLFRKFQNNTYRRRYAKKLLELKSEITKEHPFQLIQKISTILKATALKSFPRQEVARLSGRDWQNFLISTNTTGSKHSEIFALLDYQYVPQGQDRNIPNSDLEKLFDASIHWIRRHHV